MPIPTPEPGLVISYAYLWHHEHEAGREEGRKDRPSVIVLAVERPVNDTTVVVVLPITHNPSEEVRTSFAKLGIESRIGTAQDFATALSEQVRDWKVVVDATGIKIE
jgi:hypothetical protein